jgi:predicted transcriptional regulator
MHSVMTAKKLKEVLARAERWPEAAQAELAELVLKIDAELGAGAYQATNAELDGIDRGLKAASEGRFATSNQVDDLFRKHRPT